MPKKEILDKKKPSFSKTPDDLNIEGFAKRHIGLKKEDIQSITNELGFNDLVDFVNAVVPNNILIDGTSDSDGLSEEEALNKLKSIAKKNKIYKTFIGQGYYPSFTPSIIKRKVFENPGWYTSYTPYQAEISQGRLEALINFQTMVQDLTDLDISNASLLDEPTAAAEAMALANRTTKLKSKLFLLDANSFPQTQSVVLSRARPLNIEVIIDKPENFKNYEAFGALIQYPGNDGSINDYTEIVSNLNKKSIIAIAATDLLALTLIKSPGEMGFDIAIGNSQRFGVPLGFGGPHAAFMSAKESFKRSIPGRLVGASIDKFGNTAYRLALQTREQHIRREKATSNICTAQALLAIMASFYAIYHGPDGLKNIAKKVNNFAEDFANILVKKGYQLKSYDFFDTIVINTGADTDEILKFAEKKQINLRKFDSDHIGISFDETSTADDLEILESLFEKSNEELSNLPSISIPDQLQRNSSFLTHHVFNSYHSETELMRYIRKLYDKDIALDRAMIPLGSCTMKLNATSEMLPVGWAEFSEIHPFTPKNQVKGYLQMIGELENMLVEVTGYSAISLQPNAGSQGEYAGLLAIDAYHKSNNQPNRNICLIPESAHGTNPASAQMAGMKVVPVKCDKSGNIDLEDLDQKANNYSDNLSSIMITYPSTHGVFESTVNKVCEIVHSHGGRVYIDGANFNAMVNLCKPGKFGGDVSHLNLHKTFCIPHGGGGPGVGPIGVVDDLKKFLPGDPLKVDQAHSCGPISGTNYGSASILPISWMYIKMMGDSSLKLATQVALLNANYIAKKLKGHYKILYTGQNDMIAHECILDIRPFKDTANIEADDIAKRLIDYGFHAPTMSFPVPGTLMIEPTESESKAEIDRFINAMVSIRKEIEEIENNAADCEDNVLKNAPHTAKELIADTWNHTYSREKAAYPNKDLVDNKYWPPVGRIDNVHGDKNLMCSCPSIKEYSED